LVSCSSFESGRFEKPGAGIAFVLPVNQVAGFESQMERFKEEIQEEQL
jgi:nitrogen regulatory protein P-II 1